jgi:alkylhydroperoxidase/carboxymuconolactone decarboxylase family protein YurZ
MDYTEVLRHLALHDSWVLEAGLGTEGAACPQHDPVLDPKARALVRVAALVATGGATTSYGAEADAAVSAGATAGEIVDVLVAIIPLVGTARVVAAAPRLAMALGYDVEQAFEAQQD